MFGQTSGYSLSDIAAVTDGNREEGWGFGNNAWWIIILFLFCFNGWGNGAWGRNNQGATTREEVAYGFDINGLENGIRGIQQGLCDGFYSMNSNLLTGFGNTQNYMAQGFNGINTALSEQSHDIEGAINDNTIAGMRNTYGITTQLNNMQAANAACCCETQRQIERGFCDLNYNLATQGCDTRRAITDSTRDIIDNNNYGVRSILDFLTQDKISTLQAENQALRLAASQQAQNSYLISELSPKVPIPAYTVPNPYCCHGYYNNGCGCSV